MCKVLMKYTDWLLLNRGGIRPEIGDKIFSFKNELIGQVTSSLLLCAKFIGNDKYWDNCYVEIDYNPINNIDSKIDELIAKSQEVIETQQKQIAYLKESKSLLRKQIHGLCDIFRAAWKISADKRHEKALEYICDNSILRNGENKIIIENAINIAAYGK